MSVTRWPWADHLTRSELARVYAIEARIAFLQSSKMNVFARLSEIDALRMERQRLVNRGTARARLHHKRNGRKPRGYRWTGT